MQKSFFLVISLQIARALAVFSVDEVIIFDESGKAKSESGGPNRKSDPNILLARILQYLECPQYLRKNFFPKHSDLQYAGTDIIHKEMKVNLTYNFVLKPVVKDLFCGCIL